MDWITGTRIELEILLNRDNLDLQSNINVLRNAGVPAHRISSLYPREHFPHLPMVKTLMGIDSFVAEASAWGDKFDFPTLAANSFVLQNWFIQNALKVEFTASGEAVIYRYQNQKPWPILFHFEKGKRNQVRLAEALLLLPYALDLCQQQLGPELWWLPSWSANQARCISWLASVQTPTECLVRIAKKHLRSVGETYFDD